MKYRRLTSLVAFVLLVITLAWLAMSPRSTQSPGPAEADEAETSVKARPAPAHPASEIAPETGEEPPPGPDSPEAAAAQSKRPIAPSATAAPPSTQATFATRSGPELGPGLTPVTVVENMRIAFRQYHSRLGANPVGTNHEITSALNGDNPKHVIFVNPEDGLRISENGELIDNWGTPFFFHQLSAREMEVRSAGPDRKMWTPDDLVRR